MSGQVFTAFALVFAFQLSFVGILWTVLPCWVRVRVRVGLGSVNARHIYMFAPQVYAEF